MKRIVILIDGTWNKEGDGSDTNVAKFHRGGVSDLIHVIKGTSTDGVTQDVYYHDGVGSQGNWLSRTLGGSLGIGLKKIIQDAYNQLAESYSPGDELYLFGFSRGAYAVRALAGLIGAAGIQRNSDDRIFEAAWNYYRTPKSKRKPREVTQDGRKIKCVGVWDTVGSYGVPTGFGLESLGRVITQSVLGFHDTHLGAHVEIGLHALAIDEHRRPFVPTLWTAPKGQKTTSHVEQTWFAGAHSNVGGGYADSGLSDIAMIWMIARVHDLTGLEFDMDHIRSQVRPDFHSPVADSVKGWPVSSFLPYERPILPSSAIHHGTVLNSVDANEVHINERVHQSVLLKRDDPSANYKPQNLPQQIAAEQIALITETEARLFTGFPTLRNKVS